MELTPTSIVSLFDTNKEQRESFAEYAIAGLKEGNVNPLAFHINLKKMEDAIKRISSHPEYMSLVLDEAEKHGKAFEMHNAAIRIGEVGTKYDYAVTEDETYKELEMQKKELEAKIKARQAFLQTIPESGIADPETGSMIYRATKSSSTSTVVTLK